MSIDPRILALINQAQGIAGKPGAQLASADVSRFFSPDLGILTGTYTNRPDIDESDEDVRARTSPYLSQIRNSPEADEVASGIAQDIENGVPLIQMKKNLRTYFTTLKISPDKKKQTDEQKDMMADYMDLLDTLSKEQNTYTTEITKIKNKAPKETEFSKAGLPEPDAPYDPEPLMGGVYAQLAKRVEGLDVTPEQQKMINTRNANPAVRAQTSKNYVPIRTELVKQQRGEQALGDAEAIKRMAASQMARQGGGSPLIDALKQRMLLTKIMENPGLLNKLKG